MLKKTGRMVPRAFLVTVLLSGLPLWAAPAELQLKAWVDRNPVSVEDQFTYIVEVSGKVRTLPEVQLPDFSNFYVLSGPNVSSSYQIINFEFSASQTYRVILQPKKTGQFTLAPAKIKYGGKTLQSEAVRVQVVNGPSRSRKSSPAVRTPGRAGQRSEPNLSRAVQLKAIPSAHRVYLGQQVTLSYKIYFRTRIRDFDFVDHPETVGFWVEEYPLSGEARITREIVNGVQYNVAEIKRLALFPNKTGRLTIPPVTITVDAVVPQASRDPFDLFDNFFDNPFGKVVRRRIVSNPVTIEVKPLPASGRPQNFSGLVGDFRVSSSLDKKEVPANEAISYRVKIRGQGLLKTLNRLPMEFPLSFEVFEPRVKENVNRQGRYISSSKELEYVLIPRTPGDYQIPELRLSFFNPFSQKYQELVIPAYAVHVTRGKEVATGITGALVSKEEVALLGKDIRFIKESISLRPVGYRVYRSVWFWAAFFLPSLFLVGAYGYQVHQRRLQSDVVFARRRRASRLARKHLKKARQLLKQQQYEAFYGEISRALIGFIADKTNRPAAGLTLVEIERLLQQQNMPETLIRECLNTLNEADMRRFAGMSASSETDAKNLLKNVERCMEKLEKYLT